MKTHIPFVSSVNPHTLYKLFYTSPSTIMAIPNSLPFWLLTPMIREADMELSSDFLTCLVESDRNYELGSWIDHKSIKI